MLLFLKQCVLMGLSLAYLPGKFSCIICFMENLTFTFLLVFKDKWNNYVVLFCCCYKHLLTQTYKSQAALIHIYKSRSVLCTAHFHGEDQSSTSEQAVSTAPHESSDSFLLPCGGHRILTPCWPLQQEGNSP